MDKVRETAPGVTMDVHKVIDNATRSMMTIIGEETGTLVLAGSPG